MHTVVVLVALGLLLWLMLRPREDFMLSGWLAEYGEFDWIEAPAWLVKNETSPPSTALTTLTFVKDRPILLAIESAKTNTLRLKSGAQLLGPSTATDLATTQNEIWAVIKNEFNRYSLRSASAAGEYLGVSSCSQGDADVKLTLGELYADWIIAPAEGARANTFFVHTPTCKNGVKYYLANVNGALGLVGAETVTADAAAVSWEFRAIAGPATAKDVQDAVANTTTTAPVAPGKATPKTTGKPGKATPKTPAKPAKATPKTPAAKPATLKGKTEITPNKGANKGAAAAKGAAKGAAQGAAKGAAQGAAKGAAAVPKGAAAAAKGAAAAAAKPTAKARKA